MLWLAVSTWVRVCKGTHEQRQDLTFQRHLLLRLKVCGDLLPQTLLLRPRFTLQFGVKATRAVWTGHKETVACCSMLVLQQECYSKWPVLVTNEACGCHNSWDICAVLVTRNPETREVFWLI